MVRDGDGFVEGRYQSPAGPVLRLPVARMFNDNGAFLTLGDESAAIGGFYDAAGTAVHRGLSIVGQPYGNYNAGCTLCVFSTSDGYDGGGAQAALSGLDYRAGAGAVAHGDLAVAGFYHFDENAPARITAAVASFDADGLTLAQPMTDEQMAVLHPGMYIATNAIDPARPTTGPDGVPTNVAYWAFLKSWDQRHLRVWGWAVPGGSDRAGQVPDVRTLDRTKSRYPGPMAFIGVPAKVFSENNYILFDGDRIYGDHATAVANAYERNEVDFRGTRFDRPHSLSFHGVTTSYQCLPCATDAASDESYAYLVNGPGLPRAYVAQVYGDGLEFQGYSSFIPGNGAPWPGTAGATHIMASFASALPSNNTLLLSQWVLRNATATGDWRDYELRIGGQIDATRDRRRGLIGGSPMGSIAFNYNGQHFGGWCGLGNNANPGLCQEGDGTTDFAARATFDTDAVVRGTMAASTYAATSAKPVLAAIRAAPHAEGDRVWCHDCLNARQVAGHGTGRWIFLDSAGVWRSDDGERATF